VDHESQALTTVQSDIPTNLATSRVTQALSQIGQALQSGDVPAAQQALQMLERAGAVIITIIITMAAVARPPVLRQRRTCRRASARS
jgi:hypothetical protein